MSGIDGKQLRLKALGTEQDAREALGELWEYFYPRLLSYAASFKRLPPSEYEDLVSDALLRAFRNIAKYNTLYSVSTWVYTIARNHFVDAIRKSKQTAPVPVETLDEQNTLKADGQKGVVDRLIDQDRTAHCRRAVQALKEKDRRLIFLKYYEGLNSTEIGFVEGIPPGTVRRRLSVIKSYMKTQLGGMYEN
jgi:RNA polymerase sigma-70 factor (ECF subfamily)